MGMFVIENAILQLEIVSNFLSRKEALIKIFTLKDLVILAQTQLCACRIE
jgi:hypothetical protein